MTKTGVAVTASLVAASFFVGWTVKPDRAAPERALGAEVPASRGGSASDAHLASRPAGTEPAAERERPKDRNDPAASYVFRVHLAPPSWVGVISIALEISSLPPEQGLAVMRAVFEEVESPEKRRQLLKAFTIDDGHPHSLKILHLGATDASAGVRDWAFSYLKDFAFRDFRDDPEGYEAWYATNGDRPLRDVVAEGAADFVQRVTSLSGAELRGVLHRFEMLTLEGSDRCNALGLSDVMKRAGLLDVATSWLDREALSPGERVIVHGWIRSLDPDEAYLRAVYLPALEDPQGRGDDFYAATRALAREKHRWAVEPLLEAYGRASTFGHYRAISKALRQFEDPRAVPAMIAVIAAEDTEASIRGVGEPLSSLVEIEHQAWHDGAWWLSWWRENRHRYPDLRLPTLARPAGRAGR